MDGKDIKGFVGSMGGIALFYRMLQWSKVCLQEQEVVCVYHWGWTGLEEWVGCRSLTK
jgi:hypothetical protein